MEKRAIQATIKEESEKLKGLDVVADKVEIAVINASLQQLWSKLRPATAPNISDRKLSGFNKFDNTVDRRSSTTDGEKRKTTRSRFKKSNGIVRLIRILIKTM